MAHEIDGLGNIRIFTFTVCFSDGSSTSDSSTSFRTSDYVDGWNRARQLGADWEGIYNDNTYSVEIDDEWISEDEWQQEKELEVDA